jgi:hypothetical protein
MIRLGSDASGLQMGDLDATAQKTETVLFAASKECYSDFLGQTGSPTDQRAMLHRSQASVSQESVQADLLPFLSYKSFSLYLSYKEHGSD